MFNLSQQISTNKFMFNAIDKNRRLDHLKDAVVGDLKVSIRTGDFSGWLKCDGRAVSRSQYADLFAIMGTSFGAGDGSSTFNLPDCRGRVTGATGTGAGLTARQNGDLVGAETHVLTEGEMPAHTHGVTDPGHNHAYERVVGTQGTDNLGNTETAADEIRTTTSTTASVTGITVNSTGGGLAHNNMQPTIFIGNVFIYTGVEEDPIAFQPVPDTTSTPHNF